MYNNLFKVMMVMTLMVWNCKGISVTTPVDVMGVTVSSITVSIVDGLTAPVVATILPPTAIDKRVTWSTNDDQVATIDNGVITGVGVGTATITVTTTDGSHTAEVTVTVTPILVSGVSVSSATVGIVSGSTETVTATVEPANAANKGLMWSSSDAQVATVNQSGEITGIGVGIADITVTTQDASNITKTIVVTVTAGIVSVTGVSIGSARISIVDGSTAPVTATIAPTNATDDSVTWSSDETSVATVNQSGEITGVGVGTVTITVTTIDGSHTAEVTVIVTAIVSVSGVSVDESTVSIVDGLTATVVATVSPANATDKSVTWSSDETSIATVDNGVITALGVGTATITVTTIDGSHTAEVTVTVTPILVSSVSVDESTVSIVVDGLTATILATVSPANATDDSVTWSSDETSVATVNQSGEITGVGVGTVTITVTTIDGSHTAEVTVTVTAVPIGTISVSGVSVDESTVSIVNGLTATVVATVSPANATDKSVTWSSDETSIATVDNGVITALGVGTATITVTTIDGSHTAEVTVTVTPILVSSVSVDESTVSIVDGLTATILATVSPANATDKSVTWSSSDAQVATVDQSGEITAVGEGTANITVTTQDASNITETIVVTVTAGTVSVTGVSISGSATISIVDGSTASVTATIVPANATDNSVTWSSSDDQVATVDNGVITAAGAGTATITVTTIDGSHTATVAVTVTPILVSGVSVSSATVGIVSGSTETVTATVEPANAANKGLMWSSSDDQVATVNQSGEITAVGVGTADITVTTSDGSNITKTIVVTVTAGTVSVTGVSISGSATISIVDGSTAPVTATIAPANATNNSVTWSSSDAQVATVDQSGEITALGVGTVTITVTTSDGPYIATVAVTVTPILVSSVSVDESTVSIVNGLTATVTVTVLPVNATNQTLTWSSNVTSVATVNQSGVITAVGVGIASIFAETTDGSDIRVRVTVTVTQPPSLIRAEGLLAGLMVTQTIDANNVVNIQKDPMGPYDKQNSIFAGSFNSSATEGLIYESGGGTGFTFGYENGAFIVSVGVGADIDAQVTGLSQNTNYVYILQIVVAPDAMSNASIKIWVTEGTTISQITGASNTTEMILGLVDYTGGGAPGYLIGDGVVQYPLADFQGTASEILFFSEQGPI